MHTIISQLLTSPQSMLLSESDAARGFGAGRNLPRLGFALGMRLDSGAAGVPMRAAPEDEEADGVGVGADRSVEGLLTPLFTRTTPDREPGGRILPGGEGPVVPSG